jgi:hypothetical protein
MPVACVETQDAARVTDRQCAGPVLYRLGDDLPDSPVMCSPDTPLVRVSLGWWRSRLRHRRDPRCPGSEARRAIA